MSICLRGCVCEWRKRSSRLEKRVFSIAVKEERTAASNTLLLNENVVLNDAMRARLIAHLLQCRRFHCCRQTSKCHCSVHNVHLFKYTCNTKCVPLSLLVFIPSRISLCVIDWNHCFLPPRTYICIKQIYNTYSI